MAHWDNENFHTETPSENILCRNCKFRLPAIQIGNRIVERYTYGACGKYDTKPHSVLWNGAFCPLYRKDQG